MQIEMQKLPQTKAEAYGKAPEELYPKQKEQPTIPTHCYKIER